jgi:hypothetical protein
MAKRAIRARDPDLLEPDVPADVDDLGAVVLLRFLVHVARRGLNPAAPADLPFPLGFYMAAQGSLIASCSSASGTRARRTDRRRFQRLRRVTDRTRSWPPSPTTGTIGGASFVQNLSKIYLTYTGTFIAFVLALGVLEAMGVSTASSLPLHLPDRSGLRADRRAFAHHTRSPRTTSPGASCRRSTTAWRPAADWMSAASFIGHGGLALSAGLRRPRLRARLDRRLLLVRR